MKIALLSLAFFCGIFAVNAFCTKEHHGGIFGKWKDKFCDLVHPHKHEQPTPPPLPTVYITQPPLRRDPENDEDYTEERGINSANINVNETPLPRGNKLPQRDDDDDEEEEESPKRGKHAGKASRSPARPTQPTRGNRRNDENDDDEDY
uniref:Secreted protein n=1 Tax=Panagrolaimus sp. PS1159 TaxID=55785 RepID=A0AC35FZB7_9BILA